VENLGVLNYSPIGGLPSVAIDTIHRLDQSLFNAQNYQLVFHIDVSAFTAGNGSVRLEFRRLDANNYYYVRLDDSGAHLRKVVAGVDQAFPAGSYTLADAAGLNAAEQLTTGAFDFIITADFNSWTVVVNGTTTHIAEDTIGAANTPWFDRGAVAITAWDVVFTGDNYVITSWIDGV